MVSRYVQQAGFTCKLRGPHDLRGLKNLLNVWETKHFLACVKETIGVQGLNSELTSFHIDTFDGKTPRN
jgi:hypothetical protein